MAESSVPGAVGERATGAGDCGGAHHYGLCRSCGVYITSSGGAVGEREEPLEQARDALLSVLTVCGLEGQDPSNTALAFQMIRDFARPAYDALVEAENADD